MALLRESKAQVVLVRESHDVPSSAVRARGLPDNVLGRSSKKADMTELADTAIAVHGPIFAVTRLGPSRPCGVRKGRLSP